MKFFFYIFILTSLGCQQVPTIVTSQSDVQAQSQTTPTVVEAKIWAQHVLKSRPVFLDARSALNFGVSHIPGAINVRWEDFSQVAAEQRGNLLADEFALARRLALWGISLETSVVVVGEGLRGRGEEGRIAWMLKYLGVQQVSVAHHQLFRSAIARNEAPPENKAIWKPAIDESLVVSLSEFRQIMFSENQRQIVILDVRRQNEIEKENFERLGIKKKIIKIPWEQFYTEQGLINPQVQQELAVLGLRKNDELIVVSQQGVRSAAVTFALNSLGWLKVRNYAGGLNEISALKLRK